MSNARGIIYGEISGIEGGFSSHSPDILIRIEVHSWLKRHAVIYPEAHEVMYFLYPTGVFELGQGSICLLSSEEWPGLPEPGSRVISAPQRELLMEMTPIS